MVTSHPNEAKRQPFKAPDAGVFSWKRVLKSLGCVLSVSWLVMLHVCTANAGGLTHATSWGKIVMTVVTIAVIFPILLFVRGRLMYIVGLPFLCAIAWTLWEFWTLWVS